MVELRFTWVFQIEIWIMGLEYNVLDFVNVSVTPKYLENREFSFTLEDDVYVRYQSFSSQEEFEKEVKARSPHKIDIGAVYTLR